MECRARLDEFHAKGVLLMAGPYGAPPIGALGVFTSRDSAEEFITGDPFVLNGVVSHYTLHDWNEVLFKAGVDQWRRGSFSEEVVPSATARSGG